MKLKTIAAIFKRNKRLVIHTADTGEQWISNGWAMYSLRGMPKVTPEIVLRIFDIPTDKHISWICENKEMPTLLNFEDNTPGERSVEPYDTKIDRFGSTFWLFPDTIGIRAIDSDFIKPLLDEEEYLTFHRREMYDTAGTFMLAAKVGLELKAIIMPNIFFTKKDALKEIIEIAGRCEAQARKDKADVIITMIDGELPEDIEINPDTGEIIEGQTDLLNGGDDV